MIKYEKYFQTKDYQNDLVRLVEGRCIARFAKDYLINEYAE